MSRFNSAIADVRRSSGVFFGKPHDTTAFGAFLLAVRKLSRQGSGGRPAARQASQNARIRFDVASAIRFRPSTVWTQILYGHHDLHNVDVVCHPNRLRICVGMVCQCFSQMRCTLAMHDDCDVLPYHFPV